VVPVTTQQAKNIRDKQNLPIQKENNKELCLLKATQIYDSGPTGLLIYICFIFLFG